jgi:5-methylcytosine-specific restriction endonuclease McrA
MILILLLLLSTSDYNRSEWKHWIDKDKDCQDTRQEVLIEESVIPVTFDQDSCKVVSGLWVCYYTGSIITDPKYLQIDHVVPLKNAYVSGGWKWDSARKRKYANYMEDTDHLVAVVSRANQSKGSRSPDLWKPNNKKYWCEYAINWIVIKLLWELDTTEEEDTALKEMLRTCGGD